MWVKWEGKVCGWSGRVWVKWEGKVCGCISCLHQVKERKTPSLSAQASFAPFSLKVAWSGKSLIVPT